MKQYFLIKFFKAHPQLFIFFPDLILIHFIVVGYFGHVLISLAVSHGRSGDIGKGCFGRVFMACPGCVHFINYIFLFQHINND